MKLVFVEKQLNSCMDSWWSNESESKQIRVVEPFHARRHLDQEDQPDLREPDDHGEIRSLPLENVDEENRTRGPEDRVDHHVDQMDGVGGEGAQRWGEDEAVGAEKGCEKNEIVRRKLIYYECLPSHEVTTFKHHDILFAS